MSGRYRSILPQQRGVDWRDIGKRVAAETWNDDVFGRAAQLAYYWLFSLFPILLIIVVILGYVAQGGELQQILLTYLERAIPGSSFTLVRETLAQVSTHATAGKLSIGLITTIWAASSGMSAAIAALNKAYEVPESRAWWKARLLAAGLTMALAVLVVLALAILLYGSKIGALLGDWLGLAEWFDGIWNVVQWPIVFAFVFGAVLLVYRFAPHLEHQNLAWLWPGATVAVLLWLALSFGLRVYLRYFNTYGTVYGVLGAVLILLIWIYLSSAALLIGGELNSEIENAAAAAGAPDAKHPGERAPHERA